MQPRLSIILTQQQPCETISLISSPKSKVISNSTMQSTKNRGSYFKNVIKT